MLNRSASLAMSTSVLKALPGKLDIKRHSPSILYFLTPVTGAPGSEKDVHAEKLLKRYPDWAHVNMGNLIREEIVRRGDAHSKWRMTKDLLSKGEAAPEVS